MPSQVLNVAVDTWVDEANPTVAHGSDTELRSKFIAPATQNWPYLRFSIDTVLDSVPLITPTLITLAELVMIDLGGAVDRSSSLSVVACTSAGQGDAFPFTNAMVWNNRMTTVSTQEDEGTPVYNKNVYTFNVTALVKEIITNVWKHEFKVNDSSPTDPFWWGSLENPTSTNRPQLTITWNNPPTNGIGSKFIPSIHGGPLMPDINRSIH